MTRPGAQTPRPVVGLIWAQTPQRVIGRDGQMPWHVPEDLAYFKQVTSGAPVIMGRATWESLPERFRPLPGRVNIVLSSQHDAATGLGAEGALPARSLPEAVELAAEHLQPGQVVWIMGGGAVYAETVQQGLAQIASVTTIDVDTEGDTFAPELDPDQWEWVGSAQGEGWDTSETGVRYRFDTYRRKEGRV
ncbi:dihydrofolate reductase [Nesterenkonia alba]|uniref:dihydrofolate reductase n=1 Tax=Nesterenkonia alba TaxID=515814 RepID=UPI0003B6971A|nr:dihydrofolate reductase [Nesterenkonia alba]